MFQTCQLHNYGPTLGDLCSSGFPVFNNWWSTFVPEHKEVLIDKIKKTYWFNQIGAETPDRFAFYLNAQLQNIMPYYNKLYESELIKINPMVNHAMKANGRTIENLVKKANSSDDKFAKAIRDFAGVADKAENVSGKVHSTTSGNRVDTENNGYSKQGTDDKTENTITHNSTAETTDRKENESTDSQNTGTEKIVTDVNGNVDSHENTNIDETTKATTQYGQTQSENTVAGEGTTYQGEATKEWTETLDDDSTTKTVTNLTEHSETSAEKDYADTPQKQLNTGSGNSSLRRDYLTNVTWDSSSTDHDADTTQDVTFADDQTKTHTETSNDSSETNVQKKSDTSKQLGGSDVTTTDKSGDNTKDTNTTETSTTSTDKNSSDTLDKNVTTSETINTDSSSDGESTTTTDDDWTERGSGTGNFNSATNSTTTGTNKTSSDETTQTHERADTTSSSSTVTNETSDSTRDEGVTNITEGFMNVSSSALLNAFRETFLNIDAMIIEELRSNFMLVY